MGIAGMLLFIPLCSVLYALLRRTVYERLQKKEVPPGEWAVSYTHLDVYKRQ